IDALLNIAGGFDMSGAADTTPAQLEAQLDINLRTAFNATRAMLPHMLESGGGFVLGVGAGQAINGGASCGTYAASKAAMIAWMKSMHAELAPKGIEFAIVYPMGAVDTAGNRAAMPDVDPASWIDPADLAATMLHLVSRGARGQVREARVYPPI
ncbi:MAG TPA: SDR family NAD(P)-dependent oxidoreductase, partial [Rhodanobacteraceae bacterium]